MLVDNGVTGDSRVQKSARSAAAAGWDVTLLGRSPSGLAESWQLGDAEVRLLPVPATLAKHRHEYRRRWLRAPLAYPPGGLAGHRMQWVRAWRADLRLRTARSGASPRLRAEEFAAGLLERWVDYRVAQHKRSPRRLDGPWDRTYTAFWQRVMGDRAWRRLAPGLWDWELAFGTLVDRLAPDLIHANDFRMLGVGARAKVRARAKGREIKLVWDAHEFLPGVRPVAHNARWLPAHVAHEREYAPYADAVLTVSDSLAELLRSTHSLPELPTVVLNAPEAQPDQPADDGEPVPDVRARCGVGPTVPLVVYSGAAAEQRGLGTMVEALPQLDGVHAAFVVNRPDGPYVQGLLARAAELGVADRVHVLPYVPHWQVVPFLAGADVGVIPIHHWPNHEIALITKFFEYSHARLPLVVSDVKTMASTVRSTSQGEVFRAEDVADYVRAVRHVLADPQPYRAAYEQPGLLSGWTWEAQARVLDDLYSRLLPAAADGSTGPAAEAGAANVRHHVETGSTLSA
ncbi:glycosyltransferase family 4 protein [Micromonospora sp. RTP1Z1]|uniref:glycosyltransferase family 4 protein n=1 Tax=Micromonospora sp. RTP1Z1 TaxID=2994043 RepID=UPI0029C8B341|nr:glycosyltransferase family 4 protein [Micromonospora sp. RTP1Z1]